VSSGKQLLSSALTVFTEALVNSRRVMMPEFEPVGVP